jgi:uncharacterized integral membrane protein
MAIILCFCAFLQPHLSKPTTTDLPLPLPMFGFFDWPLGKVFLLIEVMHCLVLAARQKMSLEFRIQNPVWNARLLEARKEAKRIWRK